MNILKLLFISFVALIALWSYPAAAGIALFSKNKEKKLLKKVTKDIGSLIDMCKGNPKPECQGLEQTICDAAAS